MKKYILLLICLATINISANTENEARKILDNQQKQLDNSNKFFIAKINIKDESNLLSNSKCPFLKIRKIVWLN